jgi:hypothetical protein
VHTDIGDRSGIVIRCCFYNNGNSMRTIAFKHDFFEILFILVGRSGDSRFHTILGHIEGFGILQYHAQSRIRIRIRSTQFYRDGDLFTNPRKCFRSFGIVGCHFMLTFFKGASHFFLS